MSTDVERERARIAMPIEKALEDEYRKGVEEFRASDSDRPFVGDALVHMHDQLLGAINYGRQIGREDDSTNQMINSQHLEPQLVDMVYKLRAIYRMREIRRERLAREADEAKRRRPH